MGRPLRPLVPDGVYHVTTRGVRKTSIYRDLPDRETWLRLLGHIVETHGWRCSGYCEMTTHFHAVVQTPEPDISAGMHRLNSVYARYFNERHGLEGHLFERRFQARLVEDDDHLLETVRYVVLNPVRAGMCADPGEWRWSSYRASVGDRPAPRFLELGLVLDQFSVDRLRAFDDFRAFVAEAPIFPAAA